MTTAARGARRGLAVLAAGTAVALASLLAASPAWAAGGRISDIQASGAQVTFTFGATDVAPGQTIDPASVKVQLDGVQVAATATPQDASKTAAVRRSVLVMDTSGSLAGAPIEQAKQAANAYLKAVPKDVEVGLVTFADRAVLRVRPTTDRAAVAAQVNGLTAGGSTALYDGVILAVATAGSQGSRNLLLMSDGADEGSRATLAQAVTSVKASGATLDAVSLGTTAAQLAPLRALAVAGDGRVITTTQATALADAFQKVAADVSSQVRVVAQVPSNLAQTARTASLSVTGTVDGQPVAANAAVPLPAQGATASPDASQFGPQPVDVGGFRVPAWSKWVALGAVFLGLAGLLFIALTGGEEGERGRVRRRLSRWSLGPRGAVTTAEEPPPPPTALGQSPVARSAVEFAGRVAARRGYDSDLARRLDAAGVPLKPGEWVLIHLGITLGAGLLLLLLSGFGLLAGLLGLALGVIGPFVYLTVKEDRRRKSFADALPDTLQLLAGSLSAGYSLPQAVDAVTRESKGVMATELNRAIVEARLGVPLEEALDNVAMRMRSKDFAWVVMAIRVQREVGGNLAEVLNNVGTTMRDRERIRRQVQALSAEGRLSAIILGALPIVFAVYLALVRPDYVGKLFTNPLGIVMVVVAVGLLLAGIAWLRKVIRVEV